MNINYDQKLNKYLSKYNNLYFKHDLICQNISNMNGGGNVIRIQMSDEQFDLLQERILNINTIQRIIASSNPIKQILRSGKGMITIEFMSDISASNISAINSSIARLVAETSDDPEIRKRIEMLKIYNDLDSEDESRVLEFIGSMIPSDLKSYILESKEYNPMKKPLLYILVRRGHLNALRLLKAKLESFEPGLFSSILRLTDNEQRTMFMIATHSLKNPVETMRFITENTPEDIITNIDINRRNAYDWYVLRNIDNPEILEILRSKGLVR